MPSSQQISIATTRRVPYLEQLRFVEATVVKKIRVCEVVLLSRRVMNLLARSSREPGG